MCNCEIKNKEKHIIKVLVTNYVKLGFEDLSNYEANELKNLLSDYNILDAELFSTISKKVSTQSRSY
jgi:hypothetical protein